VPNKNINKYDLLNLFNETFDRKLTILPEDKSMDSDKTLINTRTDFDHKVPDYPTMVEDMRMWVDNHEALYPHYRERERERE
jgi:dTDP-4-dehydrorhamnose reductase